MDLKFWIAQVVGILAWLLLILSFYRKNTNKILVFQIIGTLLYCVHYYMLDAWSGLFICCFETLRDTGYYKTDFDGPIYYGSIPIYAVFVYVIYRLGELNTVLDIFPLFASLIDGWALTHHKRIVLLATTIEYTLWVVYDILVMSISGAITDGLIAISNFSLLVFKKSLFSNTKFNKLICK